MAQSLIEKEVNLYESKRLNVCTTLPAIEGKNDEAIELGQYHIAWAVFQHLNSVY